MGDYYSADIVDGKFQTGATETYQKENTVGTSKLGKDAFLQLLVAQLQCQDPLNPQTNQEFIGELTQFSTLEEMQNMTGTLANAQAMGLVGRNVILEVGKSSGLSSTTTVAGYVEYVKMVDGKAMLSIKGELYDYADLDYVLDDDFLAGIIDGEDKTDVEEPGDGEEDKDEIEVPEGGEDGKDEAEVPEDGEDDKVTEE